MLLKPGSAIAYDHYVKINQDDPYGKCIVKIGEAFANAMEGKINAGDRLADIAADTFREVDDRPGFGITGFMYGCMMEGLSTYWAYGEELRRWHNVDAQIGTEGDRANESGGVLNPALLNVRR